MISLNITYYNEPKYLKWWYDTTKRLNDQGYEVYLNVGDDGSQREPAIEFFEKNPPLPSMQLFVVTEDIGFNSHGTRNLLMKHTKTDWNLLSDIDRRYPDETLIAVCDAPMKQGNYYSFWEIVQSSSDRFSVNDLIVHKEDFWRTGGYDEEFVNIHFGDRHFLDCLRQTTKRRKKEQWKIKYARNAREVTWADVPTTQYPDDNTLIHPNDRWPDDTFRHPLKDWVTKRNSTPEGRLSKPILNFPWKQIF